MVKTRIGDYALVENPRLWPNMANEEKHAKRSHWRGECHVPLGFAYPRRFLSAPLAAFGLFSENKPKNDLRKLDKALFCSHLRPKY
jgi:hypothetical protein